MEFYGKAAKAKEEQLINQYKEELNLIILDEIAERKIEAKSELMIESLDKKISQKDWVKQPIEKYNKDYEPQDKYEESIYLLVESKDGYEFLIKVDNKNNFAEIVNPGKKSEKPYKVTYSPNKGTGEEEQVEVRSGFAISLKECNYHKEGYKFGGWCEDAEGNQERYSPNATYKPEKDVTLYATWEEDLVTINFDSNNGSNQTQKLEVTRGRETKLPKNSFKREKYIFVEWNTDPEGNGTSYQENGTINLTEDSITLYAVWEKEPEFSMAYGRIEVVWLDKDDNVIENPNEPVLGNMTRVKWNGTTETNPTNNNGWYEYKAKEGKADNNASNWANAKNTINGVTSYFVWIPRYAYRITYYANENSDIITGYCDGRGITSANGTVQRSIGDAVKTVEEKEKSYIVHPAFRDGTSNKFKNGEWDSELSGIWVAKYESSRNDATSSSMGSGTSIKIVPSVRSWKSIKIGDAYSKAYNYDRNKGSHLIKNSEWGAVAYLTQSQYGRNGHDIDVNNNAYYITGMGGGSTTAGPSDNGGPTPSAYNTSTGMKASSTGNIYGIYDLSGGAGEYSASFIANGKTSNGSTFAIQSANLDAYKILSTKYYTIYPHSVSDSRDDNYRSYSDANYGYGDAILETSSRGNQFTRLVWSDFTVFIQ